MTGGVLAVPSMGLLGEERTEMSLRYYAKHRDEFEMPESGIAGINVELAFPCCCCMHHAKEDDQYPCSQCDHNTNAEPWSPNASGEGRGTPRTLDPVVGSFGGDK